MKSDEPLYFADVCAGPGGFSEYVLWKRKWRAKVKLKGLLTEILGSLRQNISVFPMWIRGYDQYHDLALQLNELILWFQIHF